MPMRLRWPHTTLEFVRRDLAMRPAPLPKRIPGLGRALAAKASVSLGRITWRCAS